MPFSQSACHTFESVNSETAMPNGDKDCLDHRVDQIHTMIGSDALFQAGAMIKGGRHCATMQTCQRWHACASTHGALWEHLTTLLTTPR